MKSETFKNLDEAIVSKKVVTKTSLNDVNDDVQVLLEFAKSMTDYISRINDNSWAINREIVKSDYLGDEIGKSVTALIMLDKYLDKAVALLEKAQR